MEPDKPEKKEVRVTIFNQTYTLRTSGEEREAQELARSVDELMSAIAQKSGNLDSTRVAVLACLHLADQLRSLEGEFGRLREQIERKSRDFSLLLDQALHTT